MQKKIDDGIKLCKYQVRLSVTLVCQDDLIQQNQLSFVHLDYSQPGLKKFIWQNAKVLILAS